MNAGEVEGIGSDYGAKLVEAGVVALADASLEARNLPTIVKR